MLTAAALLLLFADESLVTSARSPYSLARYIETHKDYDWEPLWQHLGVSGFMPVCNDKPCHTELLTVSDARVVVLIVEHPVDHFRTYFRFRRAQTGSWTYSGLFQPMAKYFRLSHRMEQVAGRPFLVATGQGHSGTGLSSKIEYWLDVTRDRFEPVFEFVSEGHNAIWPKGIWRETRGRVVRADASRIEVALSAEFSLYWNDEQIALGSRPDTAVYVKGTDGSYVIDTSASTASQKDLELLYSQLDSTLTKSEFLRLQPKGMQQQLSGRAKQALAEYLENH